VETEFETFTYWFIFNKENEWTIINKKDKTTVGWISSSGTILFDATPNLFELDNTHIDNDWKRFKEVRKEYQLGNKIQINGLSVEHSIQSYEDLMEALLKYRAYENGFNPDEYDSYINKVLKWIRSTDFYESPASTRYHESFKHGLLYHTLTVYNNMLELLKVDKFSNVDIASATLCCLVHDWCKIGLYETYTRNVKNEVTGQWESVEAFRYKDSPHPFGHGVTSMYMAMKLFKLTEDEALAIRYHMGRWHVEEAYINDFQLANETYPLVHLLQFADQLSITSY